MKSGINYQPHTTTTNQHSSPEHNILNNEVSISEFGTNIGDGISTDVFPPGQLANDDDAEGNTSGRLDPVTAVDAVVTAVEQDMRFIGKI